MEERTDIADNINIWNNVIIAANNAYSTMYGIGLPDVGTATDVSVRNNIIVGFEDSPVFAYGGGGTTIDRLSIQNNIFYNNGNSNTPHYTGGMVPTNNTTINNTTGNPLFVSSTDFHLQSGSPAINTGINVGLTLDYDSATVASTPEKGAYEYGSTVLVTSITVAGTGGATTISTDDGTLQMIETVLPANATDPSVTWSRINGTGTATISSSGLLTALTNGTMTARATANDGTGLYGDRVITISNQTIDPILVTGITVSGTGGATTIVVEDGTLQMLASVLPGNASNSTVTWTVTPGTGNGSIGSVSGILTAISDGTVTVRATALDGSGVYDDQVITISNQSVLTLLDGLVGYWKLDEPGAGSIAYDALNTNNLTNTGATTNQPGKIGKSFYFTGSGSSFLGNVDIPAFEFTTSMSVSAWINPASPTSYQGLVSYFYYGDDSGWDMYVNPQNKAALSVHSPDQSPAGIHARGTTAFGTDTWTHITCTWDGTYVRTYIGTTLEATSVAWNHSITYNSLARFMVGMRYNDIPYAGYIDEVALYNRTLTVSNVIALDNSGYGLSYPFTGGSELSTVTTETATSVTTNGATFNFTIDDNGGDSTMYGGVIVSENATPTLENLVLLTDHQWPGYSDSFSDAWYGTLQPNTLYYYRARGVNNIGTSYGTTYSFTTSALPSLVTKYARIGG
ncbi:MAG: Ig-like domain-containing protein, partial [Bacteroidetes bacterium]|nr:Ig-like domain-containing protein [Bacteroidota bacterium]